MPAAACRAATTHDTVGIERLELAYGVIGHHGLRERQVLRARACVRHLCRLGPDERAPQRQGQRRGRDPELDPRRSRRTPSGTRRSSSSPWCEDGFYQSSNCQASSCASNAC